MRSLVQARALSSLVVALSVGAWAGAASAQTMQRQQRATRVASGVVEAESLLAQARATAGAVEVQDMTPFGTAWSADRQLFWQAPAPQDQPVRNWPALTVLLDRPGTGRFDVLLYYTVAPDYGTVRVFVDGKAVADVNGWGETVALRRVRLGEIELAGTPHQLVFTVFGKDAASTGYFVGLDRLVLAPAGQQGVAAGAPGAQVQAGAAAVPVQSAASTAGKAKRKNGQPARDRGSLDSAGRELEAKRQADAKDLLRKYFRERGPIPFTPLPAAAPDHLRIATYNVCAFPDLLQSQFTKNFRCDGKILDWKEKAARIAVGIRRLAPDIVVVNEAWDNLFKAELARELEGSYPHAVLSVDGFPPRALDSGLMLLSRLPFQPLRSECQLVPPAVVMASPPHGLESVCATIFDESAGDDANASKAAGLARLRLSESSSAYVAFTHLQADDENSAVRDAQLRQVQGLIERCGPTAAERASNPVFFAGDLNIPGRLSVTDHQVSAESEWRQHFLEPGRVEYFSRGGEGAAASPERPLADAYTYDGSPEGADVDEIDPGATQGMTYTQGVYDGARYDYLFHTWYRPYRLQRVRLGWEVNSPTDEGGRCNLSDHQPLVVDYHTYFAPNQSVRTAKPLKFEGLDKMKMAAGSLPSAQAMLWYRLEGRGGLYGILASSVARYEVFAQNDLSRPLAPYPGSSGTRVGPKFYLPKPPYFIRVYPKEGQASGNFTLQVTRVDCASPDTSCPLIENTENKLRWPTTIINDTIVWADEMWLTFLTNVSSNQEAPELEFSFRPVAGICADSNACSHTMQANTTRFRLDLLPSPQANPPAEWVVDRRRDRSAMVIKAAKLAGGADGALKEYLLRITRTQEVPANASPNLTVEYRTPLLYLFIGSLNCIEEWQGFGDPVFDPSMGPAAVGNDDVFARFVVDSPGGHENMPPTLPTVVPPGWTYWGSFYNETARAAWPGPNSLRYLRSVRVDLVEWDPPLPDTNTNDPYTPSSPAMFGALAWGQTDVSPGIQWVSDDYAYELVDNRVTHLPFDCMYLISDADGDGYSDTCQIERVPLDQ